MKKTALHFKIASWSCRHPGVFYTISVLTLLFAIGCGAIFFGKSASKDAHSNLPALEIAGSDTNDNADWTPVEDMDLSDGIKCRLYKKPDTSITNCYKLSDGVWSFYQSF